LVQREKINAVIHIRAPAIYLYEICRHVKMKILMLCCHDDWQTVGLDYRINWHASVEVLQKSRSALSPHPGCRPRENYDPQWMNNIQEPNDNGDYTR